METLFMEIFIGIIRGNGLLFSYVPVKFVSAFEKLWALLFMWIQIVFGK